MSDIFHLIADARGAAFEHRFEDAAALASRALKSMPTCLVALRILAWSQLELDADEALATFEKCAAYDPEDALAYVGQAIWYQKHRDNDSAVSQWVRAWELDPHNQEARITLGNLLLAGGASPDRAAEQANAVLALNPNSADAYALLASIAQAKGDKDGASKNIERAISLDPARSGFR